MCSQNSLHARNAAYESIYVSSHLVDPPGYYYVKDVIDLEAKSGERPCVKLVFDFPDPIKADRNWAIYYADEEVFTPY